MAGVAGPGPEATGWLRHLDHQLWRRLSRHAYVRATGLLLLVTVAFLATWSALRPLTELRLSNYVLLHSFLETCSIVVCVMVFVIARAPRAEQVGRNMLLVGVAFLGVALLDFLHTHSYAGMPAWITPSGPEKAINFWLAARFLAAAALLAAATLSWEQKVAAHHLPKWMCAMLAGVSAVTWIIIERPHWIASTYVEGKGLTGFKIGAEFVVILANLAAAAGFLRMIATPRGPSAGTSGCDPVALLCAAVVTAMAEVFFTIYSDVNGIFNVVGHIYKVIGAWLIYRGLVAINLHEVETRAKLALEGAQLGAWAWDLDTDLLELDNTAALVWGLPSAPATTMTALSSHVHPEDAPARQVALERALDPKGNGFYISNFRIIGRDGAIHHIISRAKAEYRHGKPTRLIGVVRDDTQRWRIEQAERLSEARLTGILSIAADAIISIDEAHRIIMFNQGAEQIFGYQAKEIMGRPLEVLIPQRFRTDHPGHIQRFASSGVAAQRMGERREVAGLRKDGTEFPAEASISKLVIGSAATFTVVLRDVTDRKRQEQELERRVAVRTAELSALLDAVPDGIVQTDSERIIRMPNAATLQLFGYTRDELIGKPSRILLASPADEETLTRAWEALHRDLPVEARSIECRRKDGSTFTAMVRGSAVRDASGRIVGRVGMIRDVTDELKRQQALAVAQRMEAFGQLTGGIAHDFNNLLTVISGNLELLEMRLEEPRQLALLTRAQSAAEMGARLTSRLLTFARRRQLTSTLISLNEQITQMVDLLRRSIGEHITLTTNLAPRLPLVKADPSEIENAVLNLAINARDAMPSGGTIVIETSEHVAGMDTPAGEPRLNEGRYVRLSVTDTGTGMPPDVAERAFEPFYTTKPHGKGTGLGLSTIHGFAQQSGGTVTLDSLPGQGTTVTIYLPSAGAAGQAVAITHDDESIPLSAGERVLLVEDNPEVRQVARVLLEGLGYGVEEVRSGVHAIERLKKGDTAFDIVFCDVVMPGGVSGFDVGRWIREHAPGVRVLLTSGFSDEVAADGKADMAGNFALLGKPYSRMELARALRQTRAP